MTLKEFIIGFDKERKHLVDLYFYSDLKTDVGQMIQSLKIG